VQDEIYIETFVRKMCVFLIMHGQYSLTSLIAF